MCFVSLNSSDIACGEYASRTLAGKQAPSMAKTTAIDSKQCRRAKPVGSPTLLCALGSRFWGESPDDNVILMCAPFVGRFNFLYVFAVVAFSRRSSPWTELRSLLRTAGWRICQRWCLATRYLTCFN